MQRPLSRYVSAPPNALYANVGALIDEFARCGVRHAVVCPGSRSTPLAMALAEELKIRLWMHVDERSAAFFALGLARRAEQPVLLVCTSGTAAANFFPAIVEANLTHVPLLVATADRPPELRENGAPQTIDQHRLYGSHVRWYVEAALPEATNDGLRYTRTLACRATSATTGGPVHLNLPFREPLVPTAGPLLAEELRDTDAWQGRPNGEPFVRVTREPIGRASDATIRRLAGVVAAHPRGLIVAGPQPSARLAEHIVALGAATGYPVLADALSGVRGSGATLPIASYDAFLRDTTFSASTAPEVVLRFGAMPTSKPVLLYLQQHAEARMIVVDEISGWPEPTQRAAEMISADTCALCDDLTAALSGSRLGTQRERATWSARWQWAEQTTQVAITAEVVDFEALFEGRIFTELASALSLPAQLVVGNSMPVRDLDTFFWPTNSALRVMGNRGANGIDGIVSTALGLGAAEREAHTVLVLGDLSLYHDLNGLLAAKLYELHLTIIVPNNDGGGIFSFLPQAEHPQHFEQLFGTPLGLDFSAAVALYGGRHARIANWREFRRELERAEHGHEMTVIEVPTERVSNVQMHRRLWRAVSHALAASDDFIENPQLRDDRENAHV